MPESWIIVGACLALSTTVVRAQSAEAEAESLFREGRKLVAEGKLAEACIAFATSQKRQPAVSTLLNLANCREKNGQLATAWGLFLEAERETRNATDSSSQQLHAVAEDRARKLEPRLSRLTLAVPDASRIPGLAVVRDHDELEQGVWNRAMPIDGGSYRISAHATGSIEWSTTVTIAAEGESKVVRVPHLDPEVVPPRAVSVPPPAPAPHVVPPPPASRWAPLVVAGGATILLGGALGFELWGESKYDRAVARQDAALWHSANTDRYLAEGLAVAGIAGIGVATYLYFRGQRISAEPMVSGDRTGLRVSGVW